MDEAVIDEAVLVGYPITEWTDNWYTIKAAEENKRVYAVSMIDQFAQGAADELRRLMSNDRMLGFRLGAVCPYDEMWEPFDYDMTSLRDAIDEDEFWSVAQETDALVQILAHTSQLDQALELVEQYILVFRTPWTTSHTPMQRPILKKASPDSNLSRSTIESRLKSRRSPTRQMRRILTRIPTTTCGGCWTRP